MGKSTINGNFFNSYVNLPEGTWSYVVWIGGNFGQLLLGFQATASAFLLRISGLGPTNSWYCSALLLKHLKTIKLHFADSKRAISPISLEKNLFLDYFYHDKQPENCHGSPLRGPARPGLQKHHGHSMLCALAISDHGSVFSIQDELFWGFPHCHNVYLHLCIWLYLRVR